MRTNSKLCAALTLLLVAAPALAQVTFYEGEGFRGRTFTAERPILDMSRVGFNDRASSVIVDRGQWLACEDADYEGRCVILRPGSYDSLRTLALNNRISSVRPYRGASYDSPQPTSAPNYQYRRRPNEAIYEAEVTSVRAVVGPPEERCWIERHEARGSNVPGAIVGGILGGVLGHQIGSGRGNDAATAAGAVAGAAIGSRAGTYPQDVRRCERVASSTPAYWDVTYEFRGIEHRAQLAQAPGRTILVNRQGEPRG